MRICKKKCLKNCKNSGRFVGFPYDILAALYTVQSATSDWLHLAADIHSLPTFLCNLELRPMSKNFRKTENHRNFLKKLSTHWDI